MTCVQYYISAHACTVHTPARCYLLCRELMCAHRDAVDKLHGTPQAVELHTLIDMHHTVGGRGPAPHPILQEAADARQDDLEHGKATAQAFFGQQVSLTGNGNLLVGRTATIFKYDNTQERHNKNNNKINNSMDQIFPHRSAFMSILTHLRGSQPLN